MSLLNRTIIDNTIKDYLRNLGIRGEVSVYLTLVFDFENLEVSHVIIPRRFVFENERDRFIANLYGLENITKDLQFPVSRESWNTTDMINQWTCQYTGDE